MSSSSHRSTSGPGGPGMWDPMPLAPPVAPPTPSTPEEFVWSKPERLKGPPVAAPGHIATPTAPKRPKGRPVKKAAKRTAKRRIRPAGNTPARGS